MRRLIPLLCALALTGCGRDDGEADLPAACKESADAYVAALRSAPSAVSLSGVLVSDCLDPESSPGDVQLVGSLMVGAAQRLAEGGDALPLGYLVGAVRRVERGHGFYAEVLRRIEQEARPFRRSPGFERGLRAGRTSG